MAGHFVTSPSSQTMADFCEQVNSRVLREMKRAKLLPEMRRIQESWVAAGEKHALLWLAGRTPQWIGPDHLTLLGLGAQAGAGLCYGLSARNQWALLGVIACLALNWLGDSLDGNLAPRRMPQVCLFSVLWYREIGDKDAINDAMGSINNLSSSYLHSILGTVLQGAGLTTNTTGNSQSTASLASAALQPDNSQLSPFAGIMSMLQQLQQTNPSQYQQITQQIATNLETAAQTAQANGNSTAANQLNQLSTDFTSASQSGQLPNVQDLAQAIGSGHHHHHFHAALSGSDNNSSSSWNSSASQTLSQFLSAMQSSGTQNDALNPMAIILNTLSNAGISSSN